MRQSAPRTPLPTAGARIGHAEKTSAHTTYAYYNSDKIGFAETLRPLAAYSPRSSLHNCAYKKVEVLAAAPVIGNGNPNRQFPVDSCGGGSRDTRLLQIRYDIEIQRVQVEFARRNAVESETDDIERRL